MLRPWLNQVQPTGVLGADWIWTSGQAANLSLVSRLVWMLKLSSSPAFFIQAFHRRRAYGFASESCSESCYEPSCRCSEHWVFIDGSSDSHSLDQPIGFLRDAARR